MTTATLQDRRLTHSQIQTTMTCARKGHLAYGLGIRPATEAQPLRMGRAFHLGWELRAGGLTPDNAVLGVMAEYDKHQPDNGHLDAWLVEREIVARLLSAYFWYWQNTDDVIKWVASELAFELPVVNPETGRSSRTFTLAGKIDGVALISGRRVLVEHKTTSSDLDITGDYWRRLRIDSQVSIYYLAAMQLGYCVDVVVYDVVRKPSIRPRQIPLLDACDHKIVRDKHGKRIMNNNGTPRQSADTAKGYVLQTRTETPQEYGERLTADIGERPEWYFARREVARTKDDLLDTQYELWQVAKIIHECDKHGRWPRNTQACIGFGKCPYFDLCTSNYDLNSGVVPEGYVRVDDVHQELIEIGG